MSRRGNCWDNAVAESFFSSLKKNASGSGYINPGHGPADIFDYIEVFYNRNRRHSHLGGVSPRPSNRPREDRNFLPERGHPHNGSEVSRLSAAIHTLLLVTLAEAQTSSG